MVNSKHITATVLGFTRRQAFALAWATGRSLKRVDGRWIVGGISA